MNCRKLTGNFVAASRVDSDRLAIDEGDGAFGWHELGYASYGFCRECGSTLFFRAAESPASTSVMVGTLDQDPRLDVAAVWFAAEAQAHNTLPPSAAHHDRNG